METISSKYGALIKKSIGASKVATYITPENVYQPGELAVRPFLDQIVEELALNGSGISGAENLVALLEKARGGASCLVLPEHYSNTDLPCISYFLRKHSTAGAEVAEALVAIAGMKLNEQNPQVAAFASAFSRIVICPSRYLELYNGEKDPEERLRVIKINRASMHALDELKRQGKLILVFPAGTRYRPWDPGSKRGVREIDSYIKSFDYMCLISVNGELLKIREGDMIDDYVNNDVVRLTASPVLSCAEFRANAKLNASGADRKQAVVDAIMAKLDEMHNAAEAERQKLLDKTGGR
ncbi:MAG: 1-acyl-sn-glycerol-3-phosphate acyltransferase [Spirochaetaceae bacterium]|jgi:glycerol-3-phosphate O-acyltransferase|nr:1-acyl-sn-glycerol-3-phosphate acyltransferase [Spirochaetaceae bacterium]